MGTLVGVAFWIVVWAGHAVIWVHLGYHRGLLKAQRAEVEALVELEDGISSGASFNVAEVVEVYERRMGPTVRGERCPLPGCGTRRKVEAK